MNTEPDLLVRLRMIQGELRVNELRAGPDTVDGKIYGRWHKAVDEAADELGAQAKKNTEILECIEKAHEAYHHDNRREMMVQLTRIVELLA